MSKPTPPRPGMGAQKTRLGEILRVDQAGELAAVHIYRGQAAVMRNAPGRERIAEQLKEMEGHEQVHLTRFNDLLTERGVRPTLMSPIWRAAAFALGAGTALMGDKAAHACTEAVESVIEKHYAGQIEELKDRDPELAAELSQFRDDELAHRDLAVEEGAREAPGYPVLSAVIQAGCRAAIKISEKI
ncbi:demethoxyubiquinone hydroxylase family protein [Caulobacter segnis]|uniref:3-demethoxyubiquinol 3-hydroxylase n=2 Tax=Caulobacter segnis TaxID=88688 RepID=D5VLC2_CAUST|nr:demethoxyubiquinone hydroxylase family protein [Caulobacter segnis]ADG11295.1 Ubiquinone biosynthesis protein COQ7 [Caulobacter segnis ATCC 21756]AVQ02966.1 demethoxyubiquinone hydroxylase family protein [Caulobacter segnis]